LDNPGVTLNEIWGATTGAIQQYIRVNDGETVQLDATFKYQDYRMAGYNVREYGLTALDLDQIDDLSADFSATWDTPVGGGTRVYVTNDAGEDGYLTGLDLAGDVLYSQWDGARISEDATSQQDYGLRSLKVGSFWSEDPNEAKDICDWLLAELKDPTVHPIIRIEARPSYQFYLDLWDRVELTLGTIGISGNFRVGGIEHEFTGPGGQGVLTTLYLEPYFTPYS
jgi:hypothetical protein